MDIYVAWMEENDWEVEPWNIGCYSTKEKAEKAILEELGEVTGHPVLSLEIYESIPYEERPFRYGIETHKLDK